MKYILLIILTLPHIISHSLEANVVVRKKAIDLLETFPGNIELKPHGITVFHDEEERYGVTQMQTFDHKVRTRITDYRNCKVYIVVYNVIKDQLKCYELVLEEE